MQFSLYQLLDGQIIKVIDCPEFLLAANTPEGCSAIFGGYDDALYRVNLTTHLAVLKITIPYSIDKTIIDADGIEEAHITGLPANCTAEFEGETNPVPDGVIAFTADTVGPHDIVLRSPIHLPTVVTVTAE